MRPALCARFARPASGLVSDRSFTLPRLRRLAVTSVLLAGTATAQAAAQQQLSITSPDGRIRAVVEVDSGTLVYSVMRDDRPVIQPSLLGFTFRDAPPLRDQLRITGSARDSVDEVWTQPWGELEQVRNHYRELRVTVEESAAPSRRFDVVFRAFDDGIAFRYEVPAQPALGAFEMMDELTQYRLAMDGRAWWIPANRPNRYEYLYSASPVSRLDTVHTPLTIEMPDGLHVVIHEANLVDYAATYLAGSGRTTLHTALAPWADGTKVRGSTPFVTPWRTIELADRAADLIPATMALNLNPTSRIADTGWIEPMKYVGIWWGLHLGRATWHSGPRHGATTASARRYIEFAAANGLGGVLVEGWNTGWDAAPANVFSYTQPYPDIDYEGVARYAREHGVTIVAHNETNMDVANYERQLADAFRYYRSIGIRAVKTGYVGDRTVEGHAHHGQYMIEHWRRVIEQAAENRLMLNVHEPIKDTGERRTWPNMLTREGARGQEYNVWGGEGGNPPEHETILYFTRMYAGPLDFTPGTFDLTLASADGTPRHPWETRVRTTLAKQLALYVVLYSPMQMASDLPENYEGNPAFRFIRDVPVDWERTLTLDGRIGDFVVVARQQRDGADWYLGAITDEEARTLRVPLSFLPPGRTFTATIYADAPDAHWMHAPAAITISEQRVDATTMLTLDLAAGGGQAIRFVADPWTAGSKVRSGHGTGRPGNKMLEPAAIAAYR